MRILSTHSATQPTCFQASLSSPKYPLNAFWPQGTAQGLTMGEKALTDLKTSGFFRAMVSAPWPPMEWPVIEAWSIGTGSDREWVVWW